MTNSIKKRGQKIIKKFSKASIKASSESKEHIKENFIDRLSHIHNIRLLIFEWGLLVFALIMLAITQAFWYASSYAEESFVSGGAYTEATIGEVNSMNPLFATTNSEKVLSKLLFSTLTTVDRSGHIGIGLAEYVKADENGKTWKIKLRDDLKWSDGEPINNEDVLFTADIIKNPAVSTIYDSNLSNVKVYETEDGEIVFELPTSYADFDSALSFPLIPKHILKDSDPKTLIENSFSNTPITSGAFIYNAKQQVSTDFEEQVVYLSSNPNYYRGKTLLNSFAVHAYDEIDDIIKAINSGTVTATAELSGSDSQSITSSQIIQRNSSLNSGAFIFFNTTNENIKNVELRTAIRQGINLEKIRNQVPETLPLDYPLLESQIKVTKYPEIPSRDYEKAKTKISELAGENPIHIEIATVNSGYLPDVASAIEEELKSLGFVTNVSVYDENQEFITNIVSKRNYDLLVYEVELGADPDLLPYYHSSQASSSGLNLSNYRNSLADDLLLRARDTLDENLRIKKYETFLEYWVADAPAIGLYQPNLTYYYNKNVRTYGNDIRLVTAIDRFSDITNWAVNKSTKNKTP